MKPYITLHDHDVSSSHDDDGTTSSVVDYGYEDIAMERFDLIEDDDTSVDYEYGEDFPLVVDQVPSSSGIIMSSNANSTPRNRRRHSIEVGATMDRRRVSETGIHLTPLLEPGQAVITQDLPFSTTANTPRARRSRRHSVSAIGEGSRLYGNRMQRRVSFGNCSVVSFDQDDSVINLDTDQEESVPLKTSQRERSRRHGASNHSLMSSLSGSLSDDYSKGDDIHSPLASSPPKWDIPLTSCMLPHLPQRIQSPYKASVHPPKRLVLPQDVRRSFRSSCSSTLNESSSSCEKMDGGTLPPNKPKRRLSDGPSADE